MFGVGLDDGQIADQVKRLFFDGPAPTLAPFPLFVFHQFLHRGLPGTGCRQRIGCCQVGSRQPEIQMSLTIGLRFRAEQLPGFSPVAGLQTLLLAGFIIMDVINAAMAAVETESLLHVFMKQRKSVPAPRCVSFTQSDADKLPASEFCRSFSGALASRCRVSPSPPSAGSFAGSCNLVHSQLIDAQASRVVAGGGIGHLSPRLLLQYA